MQVVADRRPTAAAASAPPATRSTAPTRRTSSPQYSGAVHAHRHDHRQVPHAGTPPATPRRSASQTLKIDAVAPTAQITSPADGASLLPGDVDRQGRRHRRRLRDRRRRAVRRRRLPRLLRRRELAVRVHACRRARSRSGTHRLKALVTDALGNSTSSATVTITRQGRPAHDHDRLRRRACPAGFVKGPVQVSLSATDGGGGLGSTRYTLDGSDPDRQLAEYTAPFTLTDTTTVKFRSYDSHGNAEPVRSQTIKLDATAPTAQIGSPADGASLLRATSPSRSTRPTRAPVSRASSSSSTATTATSRGRRLAVRVHARRPARSRSARTGSRRSSPTRSATDLDRARHVDARSTACPRRRSPATAAPARPAS